MNRFFVVIICIFLCSTQAYAAQVEYGKTITNFAVEGIESGYFRVAEPLVQPCKFGVIYYSGRGYLSILLAAKSAGKKLSLISYNIDSSNICTATTIEIE